MDKDNAEYVVRDFAPVDRHVEELAKRERILTWRLFIDNLKRLAIPLILIACAIAIILIALGFFIWLIKKDKIMETEKVITKEIIKEVPIISERVNVVEVPKFVPVYPNAENIIRGQGVVLNHSPIIQKGFTRTLREVLENENLTASEKVKGIEDNFNAYRREGLVDNNLFWRKVDTLLKDNSMNSEEKLKGFQTILQELDNEKLPEIDVEPESNQSDLSDDQNEVDETKKELEKRLTDNDLDISDKPLRISLIWNDTNDLDLHVITPNNSYIDYRRKYMNGRLIGKLEVDKNADNRSLTNAPVENISFSNAIDGTYEIYVSIFKVQQPYSIGDTKYKIIVDQAGKRNKVINGSIKRSLARGGSAKKIKVASIEYNSN
ncbi:hypothetical protein OA385_05160 [Paracoccaceae bacterium]|nr:hypothetical protein [Paracoccaceae bacterium]